MADDRNARADSASFERWRGETTSELRAARADIHEVKAAIADLATWKVDVERRLARFAVLGSLVGGSVALLGDALVRAVTQ